METIVLAAQDHPKHGWPKSSAPGMFAWQVDGYSLRQTRSDVSEQMHSIGSFYLPLEILPYRPHIIREKHVSFATSVIESGPSMYNNMNYATAHTGHYNTPSSQMKHQSRDIERGVQGGRSGPALYAWTFSKARNYEIAGHVLCRYSSSCFVSGNSPEGVFPRRDELSVCGTTPVARANSFPHAPLWLKTSKRHPNRASAGRKERLSPAINKLSSCKDSDVVAKGALYMEDEAPSMSLGPCLQEGSQSVYTSERWAGPAFSNSPPPSSLPVPTFTRRQSRTSSTEIP